VKSFKNLNIEISTDESAAREYLNHEYNRDGDSYRSPWSNTYFPACEATFFPSAALLALEQKANGVFA
jgi:capping protein beta